MDNGNEFLGVDYLNFCKKHLTFQLCFGDLYTGDFDYFSMGISTPDLQNAWAPWDGDFDSQSPSDCCQKYLDKNLIKGFI